MSEQLREKIRLSVEEGWNKKNLDVFDELCAENVVAHVYPIGDDIGAAAWKRTIAGTIQGFPDLRLTIDQVVVEGNMAVLQTTLRGTNTGHLLRLGVPPTGKEVITPSCAVMRWENGKMAELWMFMDYLGLLQQMGILPTPSRVAS